MRADKEKNKSFEKCIVVDISFSDLGIFLYFSIIKSLVCKNHCLISKSLLYILFTRGQGTNRINETEPKLI